MVQFLSDRLNLLPRVKNREVFSGGPQLIQISIVWIVDVTGLSRIVESQSGVPILSVNDDLE